jgi:LmbE family N-acetylglucosaminyl deacetylase
MTTSAIALVIAPHADDESIGCGGTIARLSDAGWRVNAVVATEAAGREGRLNEYQCAAEGLGIADTEFLSYPEQQVPESPALSQRLYTLLQGLQPALVLAPHGEELDRDHQVLNRHVHAALRMVHWCQSWPVPLLWEYEIWTSLRKPDLLVDITSRVERKRAAILGYRSQMAIRDYASAAIGLNSHRACMLGRGRGYCEAFAAPTLPGQPDTRQPCILLA